RGVGEIFIERRQWQALAFGQLQVRGIIECEAILPGEQEDGQLVRLRGELDGKSLQPADKPRRLVLGGAVPAFAQQKHVANLEPPVQRRDRVSMFEPAECRVGERMLFVAKAPARRDGSIQDVGHAYLRPSSRQARISSRVTRGALFCASLISAIARRAS